MSDVNLPDNIKTASDIAAEEQEERLNRAKQRAGTLGIKYTKNEKAESIEQKIKDKLSQDTITVASEVTSEMANRKLIQDANMAMVRIAYTNMNPQKTNLRGEFITVTNSYIGDVTKFVPFGVDNPIDGYHVPYCIYKQMRDAKFTVFKQVKNPKTGRLTLKVTTSNEYAISILPPLTDEELKYIADRQNANGTLDDQ